MRIAPINLRDEAIEASRNHPFLVGLTFLSREMQRPAKRIQEHLQRTDPRHIYHPANTFHITIKPLGSLGVQVQKRNLGEIVRVFKTVTSEFKPFEVVLEGLAVFPTAVYARVTDGAEEIVQLNKVLSEHLNGMAVHGRFEGNNMIPHVTLATFAAQDVERLLAEVDNARRQKVGRMKVDQLVVAKASLYRYYGPPSGRAKAFEKVAVFPLKTRQLFGVQLSASHPQCPSSTISGVRT